MSDQEMLDAIDAEIYRVKKLGVKKIDQETRLIRLSYVNGLVFARSLIVKRMEGGK